MSCQKNILYSLLYDFYSTVSGVHVASGGQVGASAPDANGRGRQNEDKYHLLILVLSLMLHFYTILRCIPNEIDEI